jgi:cytochrome c oxidase subunit 1
VYILI